MPSEGATSTVTGGIIILICQTSTRRRLTPIFPFVLLVEKVADLLQSFVITVFFSRQSSVAIKIRMSCIIALSALCDSELSSKSSRISSSRGKKLSDKVIKIRLLHQSHAGSAPYPSPHVISMDRNMRWTFGGKIVANFFFNLMHMPSVRVSRNTKNQLPPCSFAFALFTHIV